MKKMLLLLLLAGALKGEVKDWSNFGKSIEDKVKAKTAHVRCPEIHLAARQADFTKMTQLLNSGTSVNEIGCIWKLTPLQYVLLESLPWRAIEPIAIPTVIGGIISDISNMIVQETTKDVAPMNQSQAQQVANWLLDKGAALLEHKDSLFSRTALQWACVAGYLPIVQRLVEKGANIHIVDLLGNAPLHLAAAENHLPVVEYLVSKGASVAQPKRDINIEVSKDPQPLAIHLAALRGANAVVAFLLTKQSLDGIIKDAHGAIPLHYAASALQEHTVRLLLAGSSAPQQKQVKDKNGLTPLGRAANAIKAKNPDMSEEQIRQQPIIKLLQYQ